MKEEFKTIPLVKNENKKRFEIEVDGYFAFIDYKMKGERIALIHTETDPELAGTGAAKAVVEKTLAWIEENGHTVLPFCLYVLAYIKRNKEWKRIVDESFRGYEEI